MRTKSKSIQKRWTSEETNYLIESYTTKTANEIALILNRSLKSVRYKINMLGLVKYDIDKSYEAVLESAKKYNCISDFKRYDYYMYEIATKNNWLSEVCSHMIFKNKSKPQLYLKELMDTYFDIKGVYNDRKTIKPLELDIYYPSLNLAFEYNGYNWHSSDESKIRDSLKKEKCLELNIRLIVIEEGKYFSKYHYIENIRKCLISEGFDITDIIVNISDICINDLSIEEVENICSRYDTFQTWRVENSWLYHRLYKAKLLDKFTSHMYKRR